MKINLSPLVVLVILILSVSTPTAKGHPQQTCHHSAYTVDSTSTHYSLIKNNSINIGTQLFIESNCDITLKIFDTEISGTQILTQQILPTTTNFQIITNNNTYIYENLTFYPSQSIDFFIDDDTTSKTKTDTQLFTSEIMAHLITTAILFTFSTSIVYRYAKNRVDNTIEVVI